MAHFEIHVLNYNGLRFLERCLTALSKINVQQHLVRINLADNGSTDSSEEFVKNNFPEVYFVPLGKNYGFTEGNNRAVLAATERSIRDFGREQDYDIFLNNDTEVTENWLIEAANVLENEPEVGIVGSKALFMDHFVALNIKVTPAYIPSVLGSADARVLGAYINTPLRGNNIEADPKRFRWTKSFHADKHGRWISPDSSVMVPVIDKENECSLEFSISLAQEQSPDTEIEFYLNNSKLSFHSCLMQPGDIRAFNFKFEKEDYRRVVQNMGSFITSDWDAGDLGFGQLDNPENTETYEVPAICGVSMFIRHKLFRQLGGFDKRYFAYFEDTDLSVRGYLAGYKCKIVPSSVLYHLHCGSSGGEWSPTFSRLVAFSHLFFNSKFAPRKIWSRRLKDLTKAARSQYCIYDQTDDLDNTPQLRAYLSYLKKLHIFTANRCRRSLNAKKLNCYPFQELP